MRRSCRLGRIKSMVLVAAAFFILPAFGVSVANAQRPPAADTGDAAQPVTRIQEPSRPILEPPQPIVGQTTGAQEEKPLVANSLNPNRPFTLATSVGTVDEDSAAIVQLKSFSVTLLPLATGSVHVRYNITAVDDMSGFCPATLSIVRVRFRNTDNSGTLGRVSFEIHGTNVTSGGNTILYTFTSDGRGAGGAFTTATDNPVIDFDFANNIYWIEATVYRSDPNQLADLGSIQIWEATGAPCP